MAAPVTAGITAWPSLETVRVTLPVRPLNGTEEWNIPAEATWKVSAAVLPICTLTVDGSLTSAVKKTLS